MHSPGTSCVWGAMMTFMWDTYHDSGMAVAIFISICTASLTVGLRHPLHLHLHQRLLQPPFLGAGPCLFSSSLLRVRLISRLCILDLF